MKFNPNKAPIEIINESAFGGAYFRNIYSDVNGKWYKGIKIAGKILILNYILVIIIMIMLINIK